MALEEDADMKETLRLFLQYVKLSKVSGRIIKHNYSPQSGMRASYKVRVLKDYGHGERVIISSRRTTIDIFTILSLYSKMLCFRPWILGWHLS